ncbi:MAG: DnaA ATPase domain-containing protein [Planctomycetota bacterium]
MTVAADALWSLALDAVRTQVSNAHFTAWYLPLKLLALEAPELPPAAPASRSAAATAGSPGAHGSLVAASAALPIAATAIATPATAAAGSQRVFLLAAGSTYAAHLVSDELAGKIGRATAVAIAPTLAVDSATVHFRVFVRPDLFGTASGSATAAAANSATSPSLSGTQSFSGGASGLDPSAAAGAAAASAAAMSAGAMDATSLPAAERTLVLRSAENVFQVALPARFALSDFVAGPENTFARQGLEMVLERPGARFGTLLLHGPAGTGKTHLLQGVCLELSRRHPHLKVLYLSCEQWVNGYLEYTKNHRLDQFRRAVRSVDVLVVDDVRFLCGKTGSQREFLYTLEALLGNGRQVILSSSLAPQELKPLDARLLERFYASLVCPLETPGPALREAVAGRQFRRLGAAITREALGELSRRPVQSLHELEGRANLLAAKAGGATIGVHDLRRWLGDPEGALHGDGQDGGENPLPLFAARRHRPVAMDRILERTAAFFHLKPEDIRGRRRSRSVLLARVVVCKLARELSGKSLQEIGRLLGDRSHATVLHCLRRFEVRRGVEPELAEAYRHMLKELGAAQ